MNESFVRGEVNEVQAVERRSWRNSDWKVGWGRDLEGGDDTVALLK